MRLGHARTRRKRSGSAERAAECRTHDCEREKPPRESGTGVAHLGAGLRRPDAAPAPPIFIHTFWRGGGTYLWSKFRACSDTLAFYEPFNESLGTDSRAQLLAKTSRSWPSKHPLLHAPYMAEYAPLLTARGLRLFRKEFTTAAFFLERGSGLPEAQCRYIASLLDHARRSGRRPVIGFSRSLGRLAGLSGAFDASHIVLLRNPAHQWMSCFAQCRDHGNDYFLIMHLMVVGQNRHHPILSAVAERYEIPLIERRTFEEEIEAYREISLRLDLEACYRVFLALFVAAYLEALPHGDLVVDMDLLASAAYRRQIERRIRGLTGLSLDLGDAAMPAYALPAVGVDFARCHAEMLHDVVRYCETPPLLRLEEARDAAELSLFVLRAKIEEATRGYLDELCAEKERNDAAARQRGAAPITANGEAMLLSARLSQTAIRLKAAEARLDALKQSTSWRATTPLRALVDLFRRMGRRSRDAGSPPATLKKAAPHAARG